MKHFEKKPHPKEKYKIEIFRNEDYGSLEIRAISSYAGKEVFGKAICHADDTYNEEKGIQIAIARCNQKIAEKRKKRAEKTFQDSNWCFREAARRIGEATEYYNDASSALEKANREVEEILSKM